MVASGGDAKTLVLGRVPARSPSYAPVVRVPRGESFVLRVRGLTEGTRFVAQVGAGSRWVRLDALRSNAQGRADMPALRGRRLGDYVVRLRGPGGDNFFVRITVTQGPEVTRTYPEWPVREPGPVRLRPWATEPGQDESATAGPNLDRGD